MRIGRGTLILLVFIAVVITESRTLRTARAATDPALTRYFEGMRARYLFTLAEGYCLDRLSRPETLTSAQQAQLTIELSRTFVAHARYSGGEEQADLWSRADSTVRSFLDEQPLNELRLLVEIQLATVAADHGDFLRWQVGLFPNDHAQRNSAVQLLEQGITRFQKLRSTLERANPRSSGLPANELREVKADLDLRLAQALVTQAQVSPQSGRLSSILEAETLLRPLARGETYGERTWESRLLLVTCARLKGDYEQAVSLLNGLESEEFPPRLAEQLLAERVRLLLAVKRPTDASSLLAKARTRQQLGGELQYLYATALIDLWEIAEFRQQRQLADDIWEEVVANVERTEEEQGGYWGYRCRLKLSNAKEIHEYGSTVAELLRQGRAAYAGGKQEAAVQHFAEASTAAAREQRHDIAMKLGYTAASIELQRSQYGEAGQRFQQLAADFPQSAQAADAHLLWAYCLGQQYEQLRTTTRRLEYARALVEHREKFANTDSAAEATWMLARLQESRLQRSKALPLYRSIPREHRRGPLAQVAVARCHEGIIQTVRDQNQPPQYYITIAVQELSTFVEQYPARRESLSLPQAEVCLRLARILLNAPVPDYRQADELLKRMFDSWTLLQSQSDFQPGDYQQTWKPMMLTATQLRIISLAGQREFLAAEQLVATLSQSSVADILKVLDGLIQAAALTDELTRRELGQLQLKVSENLNQRRDELSPSENVWLDRSLAQAYVATRQPQKAIEVYQGLLKQFPNDAALKLTVAQLLIDCGSFECLTQAKSLWQNLESREKPGTVPWLNARYHVALCAYELNDTATAKKLVNVTTLLYPQLGNEDLKAKFTRLKLKLSNSR